MRVNPWDEQLMVEFTGQAGHVKEGRGPVDGYVSRGRGKRAVICAIVRVGKRLVDVPLGDLKIVSSRKKS